MEANALTSAIFDLGHLKLIAPEIILSIWGCALLVVEVVIPRMRTRWIAHLGLAGMVLAGVSLAIQWPMADVVQSGFYGMIRLDGLAVLFGLMLLAGAAIVIAISINYLDIEGEQHGEFYALVLFATVGMLFLACTYD